MAASSRFKTSFIVQVSIEELVRRSKMPVFATFTFAENLCDKAEAMRRYRAFVARIRRRWPSLELVGVWQRQKRGAWHLHAVISHPVPVVLLREMAVECGWGSLMRLDVIGKDRPGWRGRSVESVTRYVTRYVTRDLVDENGEPTHEQAVVYVQSKRGSCRFTWRNGLHQLYRLGCDEWTSIRGLNGAWPRYTEAGWWALVRVGWETLTADQRQQLLSGSRSVRWWWFGTPGDGNDCEPF